MPEAESVPHPEASSEIAAQPAGAARITFAPRPGLVAGLVGAGLVAAGLTIALDNPGRLLFAVVAVALLIEGARLGFLRPTLAADSTGVCVHRVVGTRCYPWSDIEAVTTRTTRRLVTVPTLELDLGDTLVVIASYRLGADPSEVAGELEGMRLSIDG